jgi:hypothetical protein
MLTLQKKIINSFFMLLLGMAITQLNSLGALAYTSNQIIIEAHCPTIDVTTDSKGYAFFSGENIQYLNKIGEPNLPYLVHKVLLPPGTDLSTVRVSVSDVEFIDIEGSWDVRPVPPPVLRKDKKKIVLWPTDGTYLAGKKIQIYQQESFFPISIVGDTRSGQIRNWLILDVPVSSFRYNPVKNGLQRLKYARFIISFESLKGRSSPTLKNDILDDQIGLEYVKRVAVNFESCTILPGEFFKINGISTKSRLCNNHNEFNCIWFFSIGKFHQQ